MEPDLQEQAEVLEGEQAEVSEAEEVLEGGLQEAITFADAQNVGIRSLISEECLALR